MELILKCYIYCVTAVIYLYIVCKRNITKFVRVSRKRDFSDQLDGGERKKSKGRKFWGEP